MDLKVFFITMWRFSRYYFPKKFIMDVWQSAKYASAIVVDSSWASYIISTKIIINYVQTYHKFYHNYRWYVTNHYSLKWSLFMHEIH